MVTLHIKVIREVLQIIQPLDAHTRNLEINATRPTFGLCVGQCDSCHRYMNHRLVTRDLLFHLLL